MSFLLRCLTVLAFVWGLAISAVAQQSPDFEEWGAVAQRAQDAVETSRASDLALGELRKQLVAWRTQFSDAQGVRTTAIETVQAQLATLGDVPEGGEPVDIAQQRSGLLARLAELQGPIKTAEVAYSEAESLIRGIDGILRERQTEELLKLGPTPVNPALWPGGFEALSTSLAHVRSEVDIALDNPLQRANLREKAPKSLLLLALAFLLIVRGRYWVDRLAQSILSKGASSGRWLASFIVSVGLVIVPLIGVIAFVEAIYATQMLGLRGDLLLSTVPRAAFVLLISIWLGARIFPKLQAPKPLVLLSKPARREARFDVGCLGLVLAIYPPVQELATYDNWSDEVRAVVFFPIIVIGGLLMWRLSRLLRQKSDEPDETPTYGHRLIGIFGRLIGFVAFAAPILAAIGYAIAAQRLLFPAISTLQLLAGILILQRVITAFYVLISGNQESARESLIPVLAGFVLTLAVMPLLALIWGARTADLSELWNSLSKGLALGDSQVSPRDLLTLLVVFFGGLMVTRLVQGALRNSILPKTKIDIGGQNALVSGLGYVGISLAVILAVTSAGIDLSNIALVAGALSVGIGFGLQTVVSNFVSGIILLIERPISEGDWIEVGGNMGYVRDISVRSTRIETFDRTDVIIPNSDLVAGTVTNYTRGNTVGRVIVPVGVAYGTDPRRVEQILQEIGQAHPMVLANPAPYVVFQGFGASSLDFEIRAILRDVNWVLTVKSDMNYEIAKRFEEESIEIPFAQTDIWLRNPEVLQGAEQPKGQPIAQTVASKRATNVHLDETDMDGGTDADGGGDR